MENKPKVTKESGQAPTKQRRPFRLTHLKTLNQCITALGKTLRAMSTGELEASLGSRLCAGIHILRDAIEAGAITREIDALNAKIALLAEAVNMANHMKDITGYAVDRQQPAIDSKITRPN